MPANYTDAKVALNRIAELIQDQRNVVRKAISNADAASKALAKITTDFAPEIAAIQAMGTSNAAEAAMKAEFAKLQGDFQAVKSVADAIAASAV